ncbi:hypothetical protein Bcell_3595 [Evansella cellulosilytica DSM 2522]|uniref:Uncharacterized protein n=1 Tax=Evansella cellulosilytica (strain ATCC 21833 / DSM 2522 / FERM P-1141 / JCM 9156 / N-4) TaxID=649639 RepID=E6TS67_EVAC2|nr:hypothetical protein Bcell_3595 [Evansella cellulosilytica DSM 2522]
MLTELDLLKIILHRLAKIDSEMLKKNQLDGVIELLINQEEKVESLQKSIEDVKFSVEMKHLDNINADELLLRSIQQRDASLSIARAR